MTWTDRAACAGCVDHEQDAWFPPRGVSVRSVVAICAECPVQTECLVDALKTEGNIGRTQRFGIAGGLTTSQRWKLHRALR